MVSLAEAQFALLERCAELDPPPPLMGGYAEDALLARSVTRPHEDVDWLFPRRELGLRLAQAADFGFEAFETWSEAAPGEPFYLYGENGALKLDLGVADEIDGRHVVKVHRLFFAVDGREAPAGYRFALPDDAFDYPPVEIDGLRVRVVSPLTLYQLRAGIASQGSFGPLSERQLESLAAVRERFFPDRSEEELLPRIELVA